MKNIDVYLILALVIIFFGVCGITYGIIEYNASKDKPLEPHEGYQRTIEYVGFDGKKHQAIVIRTAQHNWVLVEKR